MTIRETKLVLRGVAHVVRTQLGGSIRTVAQLEAAHTKAVRTRIEDDRREVVEWMYADAVSYAETHDWDADNTLGMPGFDADANKAKCLADAEAERAKRLKACKVRAPYAVAKLRAPWPAVRYTYPNVPDSVHEFAERDDA